MKMPDSSPLTDAQREIMEIIWKRGEATVSQVRDALAERRELARNTVQTTIVRLEERGVNVLLQITAVTAIALAIAAFLRRSSAVSVTPSPCRILSCQLMPIYWHFTLQPIENGGMRRFPVLQEGRENHELSGGDSTTQYP